MLSRLMIFTVLFIANCNSDRVLCHTGSKPNDSAGELIFTHIIFRHGDRNPTNFYGNDAYNDTSKYWKEGLGELTDKGKQRLFELGKYLRRRYLTLLSDRPYSPDLICAQSSDVQRTWESATAALAGLFGHNQWNDTIQSIPIERMPEKEDNLMSFSGKQCPKYWREVQRVYNSDEFKATMEENKELFETLQKHTNSNVANLVDVYHIYDTLLIEKANNLTLPDWTKDLFYPGGPMEKVTHHAFGLNTYTQLMARLRSGFLISKMLNRFIAKSESKPIGSKLPQSFWVYSGHDSTIFCLLSTLKIPNMKLVPYGGCVLFELYKSTKGDYYVQLFYKNTTADVLRPLKIPQCDDATKCSLHKFRKVYKDVIPTKDFETECRLKKPK